MPSSVLCSDTLLEEVTAALGDSTGPMNSQRNLPHAGNMAHALPSVQLPGRLTRDEPQTLMNTLRPAWSTVFTTHLWCSLTKFASDPPGYAQPVTDPE